MTGLHRTVELLGTIRAEQAEATRRRRLARDVVDRDGQHLLVPQPWNSPALAFVTAAVLWAVCVVAADSLPTIDGWSVPIAGYLAAVGTTAWWAAAVIAKEGRRRHAVDVAEDLLDTADGDEGCLDLVAEADTVAEIDKVTARLAWEKRRSTTSRTAPFDIR